MNTIILQTIYLCQPVMTIPLKPPVNRLFSLDINCNQFKLFSKCLLTFGMYKVSPNAPLKALAVHTFGKTI